MTDSFTAEMGSVQSLHKQHPTTNQTAHPSSSRVAYWDPKALTHRTGESPGNADGASAPFLECGIPVREKGWRQERPAAHSARARVSPRGAGENTALCHQPLKRAGMTSGCSLSRSHGPTKPTQVEGLPNTTRATAWAVGMEPDLAWGKLL